MTTLLNGPIHPISIPDPEVDLARESGASLNRRFAGGGRPVTLRFADPETGEEVEATIPGGAMRVLAEALAQLGAGNSVTVVPVQAELSTQQAAEMMGVSRPYLVKLLETGQIAFRKVGEQRRVRLQDLLRFIEDERRQGQEAVTRMTAEAQELGLYE